MNKKILAAAIATALAAPLSAMAADDGNVTVFGQADAGLQAIDNGADTITAVETYGSHLGFKGWEGLGNGLKGVFLMSANVALDSGGTTSTTGTGTTYFTGRDSYVGLEGGFGTVALGAHGQPYKTSTGRLDIFGDTIAGYSNVMNNATSTFDNGINNSVIWFLPNMSGFSGHLQYGFDETVPTDSHQWGAQFNYSNGPLYATYAHASREAVGGVTADDISADKIGASYTFAGTTTVGAIYETINADGSLAAAQDHNAWMLSLAHAMGNNTFKVSYAKADDGDTVDNGGDMWALGVYHNFSKRTDLYAIYATANNDDGGSLYKVGGVAPSAAGEDVSGFSIGMHHTF